MRILAAAAIAASLIAASAWAEEPAGQYRVSGSNPGRGGTYAGTVTVEKTGEAYNVTWTLGSDKYTGTGISSGNMLAVQFRSGNDVGIALYTASGPNWQGTWTSEDGTQLGSETWTRQGAVSATEAGDALKALIGTWTFGGKMVWVVIKPDGSTFQCRVGPDGVYVSNGTFRAPNIIAWDKIWGEDEVARDKDGLTVKTKTGSFTLERDDSSAPPADRCQAS
jgi:hypothetical protein